MKKIVLFLFLIPCHLIADSRELNTEFTNLLRSYKVGTQSEQAYCYSKDGKILGYRSLKMQRIASITKLLTTYMASETMNLHQRFKTIIQISGDSLHIVGSRDPYFEEEKLLLLFKALNNLGYSSFKRVTFNRDFLFYDIPLENYQKVTAEKTKARLRFWLSAGNKKNLSLQWKRVRKFAEEEGVTIDEDPPVINVSNVSLSEVSPFSDEKFETYVHFSKPLYHILKTMNVQSKNYVAENIYEQSKEIKSFSDIMTQNGISENAYKIYNGSGLPIISPKKRVDNLATCDLVLKVMTLLSKSIKKQNLRLSDVVAVSGGKDLGSFRKRFLQYPETHEAVISKTGTLKHTSSLAGFLLTDDEIPFAVLNHTNNVQVTRKFQDHFVSTLFDQLGPAVPIEYTKLSIFPWDGNEFLKPLL